MSDSKTVVSAEEEVIVVSIIGLGTPVQTVSVTKGSSLAVVLAEAVLDTAGMDIRVNSEVATPDTVLTEDTVVTAMPHVEGGLR